MLKGASCYSCAFLCSLSLASLVAVYNCYCEFAIFDASFIVPALLNKLFFVNLVLSMLGSSQDALFSMCSLQSMKMRMKTIGNNGTPVQNIQQITLVESHLILTEVIWKITETKKLV